MNMKHIDIYTDGACSGNPGPGGFCAILRYLGHEKIISGYEEATTNNRMELRAAIAGLEALKEPCDVTLYSDSKYIVDAVEKGWLANWKVKGWCKADKKPVLNREMWARFDTLLQTHKVHCQYVPGHSGNILNERCDRIAVNQYLTKGGVK